MTQSESLLLLEIHFKADGISRKRNCPTSEIVWDVTFLCTTQLSSVISRCLEEESKGLR